MRAGYARERQPALHNRSTILWHTGAPGLVMARVAPFRWVGIGLQIDLTDEEAVALLALLDRAIENDRFLLSLRSRTLYGIRPKLLGARPASLSAGRPHMGLPRR